MSVKHTPQETAIFGASVGKTDTFKDKDLGGPCENPLPRYERGVVMRKRDADIEGYPLPIDPVSGWAWWRFNLQLIGTTQGWCGWQSAKRMAQLIPVIKWVVYGPIPAPAAGLSTLEEFE